MLFSFYHICKLLNVTIPAAAAGLLFVPGTAGLPAGTAGLPAAEGTTGNQ